MRRRVVRASLMVILACYLCQLAVGAEPSKPGVKVNPLRDAYYGDLHLHTSYSFDAYVEMGTTVEPSDAYRFARGEVVEYLGQPVRRRVPLDFLAVTDHSENIGVFNDLADPTSAVSRWVNKRFNMNFSSAIRADGTRDMEKLRPLLAQYYRRKKWLPEELELRSHSAWQREVEAANHYYEPGRFTTFIAFEWSSPGVSGGINLHRNVIFKGASAPYPFTSVDSRKPEDLWAWLEDIRNQGYEALAISHNGNASNGLMYAWVDSEGVAIDRDYSKRRQANEPLTEISQTKGASETHPLLSPNDEFANYEIFDWTARGRGRESSPPGSYVRDALSRGLVLQDKLGINPFKYGFVGGSDLHSGLTVSTQAEYQGDAAKLNIGGGRSDKADAAELLSGAANSEDIVSLMTTSGNLTGVWAESNTRDSIYSALRRRETFATTGTRLKIRFFGGWIFDKRLLKQNDWITMAYAKGVPMGSDLPARPDRARKPAFVIWAAKDPDSANLDRVQVIKVWEDAGQQKERVFDVAWSGNRKPDSKTGKLTAVGNTVDLTTGKYTNTIGAVEFRTVWVDPDFNPRQYAAYYVRVLEIPTPRWSTLLAIQAGLPLPKDVVPTIQERGWSSPIWYSAVTQTDKENR